MEIFEVRYVCCAKTGKMEINPFATFVANILHICFEARTVIDPVDTTLNKQFLFSSILHSSI